MEYLDRAGELFSRYGAKLYLDQVLAKKQILRAWEVQMADSTDVAKPSKPGSTEPATRFGCRDTQTGAPLKLG